MPADTPVIVVMPPQFYTLLPAPGSPKAAEFNACKAELASRVRARARGGFLDYLTDTPIARNPENFMDAEHYRANVAQAIEKDIAAVLAGANPQACAGRGAIANMYILGIHNGHHDASACVFRDYELIAAVSLERLTRKKNDGVTPDEEIPTAAIDECLAIAGISRADVDVVCASRAHWEVQSYRLHGRWWIKQQYYRLTGAHHIPLMTDMMRKQRTVDAAAIFDQEGFKRRYGFAKADVFFYNHHAAHGLPGYFFSEFPDALIYTADGIGDNVSYSVTAARGGALEVLSGGDEALLHPFRVNSVGLLYCYFTNSLGFIWNRHEGKVTGLAGFGKPTATADIMRHFSVDADGEISSDFPSYPAMHQYAREVCAKLSREDAAASVQEATEQIICNAIDKYLRRTGLTAVSMSGGIFANVRLNRAVLETTPAQQVFVFPAMGDEGLPVGGCLLYLHQRDGAAAWQKNRSKLNKLYMGRDYGAGI